MEGKLKEIVTFLEGNFAEKKEIGRKPYVPKVEALFIVQTLRFNLKKSLSKSDEYNWRNENLKYLA